MNVLTEITTEDKLYRTLITSLVNRELIQIGEDFYRFFRKGEIFENDAGESFEIMQTGIFKRFLMNDNPNSWRWLYMFSIDSADYIIPKEEVERKELFLQLIFIAGMRRRRGLKS